MKALQLISTLLLTVLTMSNCTEESNEETTEGSNVNAKLSLSGEDTNVVGTYLEVGDVAYGRVDLTGLEHSIVLVPKGATISEDKPVLSPNDAGYVESIINFPDKENSFVIVAGEQLVSMILVTNGTERRYTCESLYGTSINCGLIQLDEDSKTVIFTNTAVENTETGTLLTLNGTVKW
tara:strand:+ start:1072 stop:1608 length:537 start_codon:yes stop_codon:yes gene_type:complete